MADRQYRFPVWATQGGGLAREVNGKLIFVEGPGILGLDVGDDVPEEWGLIPANELARSQMDSDMISCFLDPSDY